MRSDATYCGVPCKRAARADRLRRERAELIAGRTCVECGKPVPDTARKDARVCGPTCRGVAHRRRHPSVPPTPAANAENTLRRGGTLNPPVRSPFRVLARTCPECGQLLTTPIHLVLRSSERLPACPKCRVDRVTTSRKRRERRDDEFRRGLRRRTDRRRRQLNDTLIDTARNHRKQWTGPELEILGRADLTHRQAADMLGRTLYAVRHQRYWMRVDPRKVTLAGLRPDPI